MIGRNRYRPETIAVVLARLEKLEEKISVVVGERDEMRTKVHYLEARVQHLETRKCSCDDALCAMNRERTCSTVAPESRSTVSPLDRHEEAHNLMRLLDDDLGTPRKISRAETAPAASAWIIQPSCNVLMTAEGRVVTWKIEHAKAKLKMSAGKPVVSPQFSLGLANLKLMLFPFVGNALSELKNGKELRTRERQQRFEHVVNNGPIGAALRVKASGPLSESIRYKLYVGEQDLGSFSTDFNDNIIHGTEENSIKDLLACFDAETIVCRFEVLPEPRYDECLPPPGLDVERV